MENAFLIVDEGHKFIEKQQGVELLQYAKYSFCTSATLGGEVGRHCIKEYIESTGPGQKVECYVEVVGCEKEGNLEMAVKEIASDLQ